MHTGTGKYDSSQIAPLMGKPLEGKGDEWPGMKKKLTYEIPVRILRHHSTGLGSLQPKNAGKAPIPAEGALAPSPVDSTPPFIPQAHMWPQQHA